MKTVYSVRETDHRDNDPYTREGTWSALYDSRDLALEAIRLYVEALHREEAKHNDGVAPEWESYEPGDKDWAVYDVADDERLLTFEITPHYIFDKVS